MISGTGPTIIGISVAISALAVLAIITRLCLRSQIRPQGKDDLVMILCGIIQLLIVILVCVNVGYGLGSHITKLSPSNAEMAVKLYWITTTFILPFLTLPKLAVTFFIERTLQVPPLHRAIIYINLAAFFLFASADVLLIWLQCSPSKAIYDQSIPKSCLHLEISVDIGIAHGVYSAILDLALAIYPAFLLRNVKMHTTKTSHISILMGLGTVAAVVSIAKVTQLSTLAESPDFTYGTTSVSILSSVEANCLILAACIPAIAPFLRWTPFENATSSIRNLFTTKRWSRLNETKQTRRESPITSNTNTGGETKLEEVSISKETTFSTAPAQEEGRLGNSQDLCDRPIFDGGVAEARSWAP